MDADRILDALKIMVREGHVAFDTTADAQIRCLWSCGSDSEEPGIGHDLLSAIGAAWANVKLRVPLADRSAA